jgi:alginate O-acetyltransferase complex protein AlgI
MDKAENTPSRRKAWLVVALTYDLGILFFFKYINFTIENLNYMIGGITEDSLIAPISIALPLGISFYTFQIMSYVIDIYKGEIRAKKSILCLSTYLCMFPQLISGPLVKYSDISIQLKYRQYSLQNIEKGLKLFTIGLGFKVLIADRIGILWKDIQTIGFESISTPLAWLGAFGYSIQLYFDFYGYSLMAIGLGAMLGFSLPDNFSHPYMAKSVSEFWRRWHISLGKWFKNYVYIPLGGNRKGIKRLVFNLFIVWTLTGIWHGASWNFILWGLMLFILISMEKLFLRSVLDQSKIFSRVYVLFVMPLTWMLFAITRLSEIRIYFGRLFSCIPGICVNPYDFTKYIGIYKWYFLAGIFFCMPFAWNLFKKYERNILCNIILLCVFWYSIYQLANGMNNPFMYFKF